MKSLIIFTVLFGAFGFAQAEPNKNDPHFQEMMKKMIEAGTPGPSHKTLADMAGSWKLSGKFWHTADDKPELSSGTSTMTMVLGGRWLKQEVAMQSDNGPFEGLGFVGFDNVKKKYQTLWLDTMSTGSMIGEGTMDASSKTIKEAGQFSCPVDHTTKNYRAEWRFNDKNTMTYSSYGTGMDPKAKEFKQMEIVYKRSK